MSFVPKTFTPGEIAVPCRQFGAQVGPLPPSVNGAQLLWAIAGVESTWGRNTTPRHEPAFDVGGIYGNHAPMPALLKLFGKLGASSFGPWQIMLCNSSGMAPSDFNDLDSAAHATTIYLNILLRRFVPQELAEIGECWNAGHITADPDYTEKLITCYKVPMPMSTANGQAGA
jgi:hypothetical protein